MKAIHRLYQYFDFKDIKPTRFEKENGLSNGYLGVQLKRSADIGSSIVELVINNCRDLNPEWLLTGDGEMLRSGEQNPEKKDRVQDVSAGEEENYLKKLVVSYEKTIELQANEIARLKEKIARLKSEKIKKGDVPKVQG